MLSASDALGAPCWTAAEMEERSSWRFEAGEALVQDARALLRWAAGVQDPVAELRQDTLVLPAVKELAARLARELDSGTGLAWVRGLPALSEPKLRLLYLALGLEMGTVVETYGRLCDVADNGGSYKDKPIPVSRTRESTGMHTDSSSKTVCPRLIGLLCVRQALRGGNSRVVSAAAAHEQLRSRSLRLLERLYGEYVRDLVDARGGPGPHTSGRQPVPDLLLGPATATTVHAVLDRARPRAGRAAARAGGPCRLRRAGCGARG